MEGKKGGVILKAGAHFQKMLLRTEDEVVVCRHRLVGRFSDGHLLPANPVVSPPPGEVEVEKEEEV